MFHSFKSGAYKQSGTFENVMKGDGKLKWHYVEVKMNLSTSCVYTWSETKSLMRMQYFEKLSIKIKWQQNKGLPNLENLLQNPC